MPEYDLDERDTRQTDYSLRRKCFVCGSAQVRLQARSEGGGHTPNFIAPCTNPTCYRYLNAQKIKTWSLASFAL